MKTRAAILLSALLLLVTAALAAPSLVDWNRHRPAVAARLGTALGLPLAIDGDLDLALLPRPRLVAEGVRSSGPAGAASLTVGRLDARLRLWPLLRGRVVPARLTLADPVLTLPASGGIPALPDGAGRIDETRIDNGSVVWTGSGLGAERIDARLGGPDSDGVIRGTGALRLGGMPGHLDLRLGPLDGGDRPLTASLRLDEPQADLRFAGSLSPTGVLRGALRLAGPDASRWLGAGVPADPFRLAATVEAAAGRLSLDPVSLAAGRSTATGRIRLDGSARPRVEATLTLGWIDLDRWSVGIAPRWALPADLDLDVDLRAEALRLGGGLLRDARLAARVRNGMVDLRRAEARLPGGAAAALAGRLRLADGVPELDLTASAAGGNLRPVLAWLGVGPDDLPAAGLHRFAVAARLSGRSDRFTLTGLDATVDATTIVGQAGYAAAPRPALDLDLAVDRLDLDAWRSAGALARRLGLGDAVAVDGRAAIDRLAAGGLTWRGVRLDAAMADGALRLRQGIVEDVAGARLRVAGTAGSLAPPEASLAIDGEAPAVGPLFRALGLRPPLPPDWLGGVALAGEVAIDGDRLRLDLAGRAADGTLALRGTVDGRQRFDLTARAAHPDGSRLMARLGPGIRPGLGHRPARIEATARIVGRPERFLVDGLHARFGPTTLAGRIRLDLTGPRPAVTAELAGGERLLETLLPTGDAARWLHRPLPMSWLDRIDGALDLRTTGLQIGRLRLADAGLQARLTDGALTVERLSGRLLGGSLDIAARLTAGPRLTVRVDLLGAGPVALPLLDTARPGARLGLSFEGVGKGDTPAALAAALTGHGLVSVTGGTLRGIDLATASWRLDRVLDPLVLLTLVRRDLATGATPFASLTLPFHVEAGRVGVETLRLDTGIGTGEGQGSIDLVSGTLDLTVRFSLGRHPQAPPFALHLTGPLGAPQRRWDEVQLQGYVARRAAETLAAGWRPTAPGSGGATAPAVPYDVLVPAAAPRVIPLWPGLPPEQRTADLLRPAG